MQVELARHVMLLRSSKAARCADGRPHVGGNFDGEKRATMKSGIIPDRSGRFRKGARPAEGKNIWQRQPCFGTAIAVGESRRTTNMKSLIKLSLASAVVSMATGCGYSAPYQTSGPSLSSQGVQVGIAGVGCYVNRSAFMTLKGLDADRLGLDLKLQVRNDTRQIATLSEGRMRLVDPAAPAAQAVTPDKAKVVSILPGETKTLPVSFTTEKVLRLPSRLRTGAGRSVQLGASTIALNPISVIASR